MSSFQGTHLRVRRGDKIVIDDLSFELRAGELLGVVGRNGSGKSTLLEACFGLLKLEAGELTACGRAFHSLPLDVRAHLVGLVGREELEQLGLRVQDILELALETRVPAPSSAQGAAIIEQALTSIGISAFLTRPLATLSSGERQLVHFARALVQAPKFLFLDEATAHLDLAHREDFFRHARHFAEDGGGVLAVVHDLELAIRCFDRLLVLHEGRVRACGAAKDVLTEELLLEVFALRAEIRLLEGTPYLFWKEPPCHR